MTAGRNIWQADDPGKMVAALKAVIHGGDSPEVAAKLLDDARCRRSIGPEPYATLEGVGFE